MGTLWPMLLGRAVARTVVLLLSPLLLGGTVLAQTPGATTESPEVADAFAELDALSATIASRLQDLRRYPGLPPAPPLPGSPVAPAPVPVQPADSGGVADAPPSPPSGAGDVNRTEIHEEGGPDRCGTREDMDLRIGEVEERFGEFRQTINAANRDLPIYREDVRDINKVCTPQVEGSLASAISRLDRLEIETVYDMAVELLVCVDQRRRTIDGGLSQPVISDIRLRLLNDEMERLTDTTHRVQDMEQALLRAVSKRRRLAEELMQIRQEVSSACAT